MSSCILFSGLIAVTGFLETVDFVDDDCLSVFVFYVEGGEGEDSHGPIL